MKVGQNNWRVNQKIPNKPKVGFKKKEWQKNKNKTEVNIRENTPNKSKLTKGINHLTWGFDNHIIINLPKQRQGNILISNKLKWNQRNRNNTIFGKVEE